MSIWRLLALPPPPKPARMGFDVPNSGDARLPAGEPQLTWFSKVARVDGQRHIVAVPGGAAIRPAGGLLPPGACACATMYTHTNSAFSLTCRWKFNRKGCTLTGQSYTAGCGGPAWRTAIGHTFTHS